MNITSLSDLELAAVCVYASGLLTGCIVTVLFRHWRARRAQRRDRQPLQYITPRVEWETLFCDRR